MYICFIFRSNCHPEILAIMREHYSIPHFLPEDAEHAHMDYIFIGYHQGAVMHVSKVLRLRHLYSLSLACYHMFNFRVKTLCAL